MVGVGAEGHVRDVAPHSNGELKGPKGIHDVSAAAPHEFGSLVDTDIGDQGLAQLTWKPGKDSRQRFFKLIFFPRSMNSKDFLFYFFINVRRSLALFYC